MEVSALLALKIFVSATATAGLLNMYVVQQLKRFSIKFHSGKFIDENLKWANFVPHGAFLDDADLTIAYMKSRTLFFPVFELVFGTLVVTNLYTHGLGNDFLRMCIFLVLAIPLAMISWQETEGATAPNVITYPGIAIGILVSMILGPADLGLPQVLVQALSKLSPGAGYWLPRLVGSLLGILVAGGPLWLMGWLWQRFRHVHGMGLGAVKTAMMVGAFVGWRFAVLMIFVAVITGSLVGVAVMARRRYRQSEVLIPFVPFLVLGGIVALLWGDAIFPWYLAQLRRE